MTSSPEADGSAGSGLPDPVIRRRRGPGHGQPPLGWFRTTATSFLLVLVYFVVPMGQGDEPLPLAVSATVSVLAVLGMAMLAVRRIRKLIEDPRLADLPTLALMVVLTMVVFAVGYFMLENSSTGQVEGLHTRLDSLYFTLTMITTVGFGDVHPAGQAARAITCLQMVFNAVFLGALIRTGTTQLARRREAEGLDSEA